VLQAASSIFAPGSRTAAIRGIPRKVVAHLVSVPTASSALRERYDQRRVPAALGATTARASSRRRRSDASEQAAAAHDNRAGAGDRVVKRRETQR